MITEEEAKTKTCPKMVYCANEAGIINDGQSGIYYQSNCLGSGCMAWRREMVNAGGDHPFHEERKPTSKGYCGAFGKPAN